MHEYVIYFYPTAGKGYVFALYDITQTDEQISTSYSSLDSAW